MIAIGLDPSFSSFGVSDGTTHERIETAPSDTTFERGNIVTEALWSFVTIAKTRDEVALFIEGPSFGSAMQGAFWDAGYLMARVELLAATFGVALYVVQPTTLKKFVTGKGNTRKADMQIKVYKKWGIEFDDDAGADKLHAFCLHRYGAAVLTGEIEHQPPKRRGQNAAARAASRRATAAKGDLA